MSFLLVLFAAILAALALWIACFRMPGRSHRGPLPGEPDRSLVSALRRDVGELAGAIGERNLLHEEALGRAAGHVERSLRAAGSSVIRHELRSAGRACANLVAEVEGSARRSEVGGGGAHYDSVLGSPGANDNATGVAAMLALAGRFAAARPERPLRFIAFANEEPPFFQIREMGSFAYARDCKEKGETVAAMISLETLGCYDDRPKSQSYPLPLLDLLYPSRGDFVAFVGNLRSRALVREAIGAFRAAAAFPSESASLPGWMPGVSW